MTNDLMRKKEAWLKRLYKGTCTVLHIYDVTYSAGRLQYFKKPHP